MENGKPESKPGKGSHPNSRKNLKLFVKGAKPGPGHPRGQRNFSTIYKEVIAALAKKKGISEDDLENQILLKGIEKAMEADYPFYKDLNDRLHGQATKAIQFAGSVDVRIEKLDDIQRDTASILTKKAK